jgi:outer membrane protein OmpA-like peptidoglycan-associated protein
VSKWLLGLAVLTIVIGAAVLSNSDWRQHMSEPGGLIGSLRPHKETYTASTKLPASVTAPSATGSARAPSPSASVELSSPTVPSAGAEVPRHDASGADTAANGSAPASHVGLGDSADVPRPGGGNTGAAGHAGLPSTHNPESTYLHQEVEPQLNDILKIRENSRGLIAMLPDALFEPDSPALTPTGRVKLSAMASVILAHPGLKIEVVGYTGPAESFSSGLSEARASTVHSFLVSQRVSGADVSRKSVNVPATQTSVGAPLSHAVGVEVLSGSH